MAKKSAASKGYRRTVKKKPFLTAKEIVILIAIVAVIILAVVLFNVFYGVGYLKASDLQPDDVVSMVDQGMSDRFVKVADAHQLDGFTRTDPNRDVNASGSFVYIPDEPTDNILSITLGGSYRDAGELADNNLAQLPALTTNGSMVTSQRSDVTVQGHSAFAFSYTNDYYDLSAAEASTDAESDSNVFCQNICLYVDVSKGRTVCFYISFIGDDDSYYLSEEECVDYILSYADRAFTAYEEEAA